MAVGSGGLLTGFGLLRWTCVGIGDALGVKDGAVVADGIRVAVAGRLVAVESLVGSDTNGVSSNVRVGSGDGVTEFTTRGAGAGAGGPGRASSAPEKVD